MCRYTWTACRHSLSRDTQFLIIECDIAHQRGQHCSILQGAPAHPAWCEECIASGAGQILLRNEASLCSIPKEEEDKSTDFIAINAPYDATEEEEDDDEEVDDSAVDMSEDETIFDADFADGIPQQGASETPDTSPPDSEYNSTESNLSKSMREIDGSEETPKTAEGDWNVINVTGCPELEKTPGAAARAWLSSFGARIAPPSPYKSCSDLYTAAIPILANTVQVSRRTNEPGHSNLTASRDFLTRLHAAARASRVSKTGTVSEGKKFLDSFVGRREEEGGFNKWVTVAPDGA